MTYQVFRSSWLLHSLHQYMIQMINNLVYQHCHHPKDLIRTSWNPVIRNMLLISTTLVQSPMFSSHLVNSHIVHMDSYSRINQSIWRRVKQWRDPIRNVIQATTCSPFPTAVAILARTGTIRINPSSRISWITTLITTRYQRYLVFSCRSRAFKIVSISIRNGFKYIRIQGINHNLGRDKYQWSQRRKWHLKPRSY